MGEIKLHINTIPLQDHRILGLSSSWSQEKL